MDERAIVEVAFATRQRQELIEVGYEAGDSVADVISRSGIASRFRNVDMGGLDVGIWGRIVSRDTPVAAGDRVEIYRPLDMDPREARRRRAEAGSTMATAGSPAGARASDRARGRA